MVFTEMPLAVAPQVKPLDVTYDHLDNKVYWTEDGDTLIYSANLDGTNKESIPNFSYLGKYIFLKLGRPTLTFFGSRISHLCL